MAGLTVSLDSAGDQVLPPVHHSFVSNVYISVQCGIKESQKRRSSEPQRKTEAEKRELEVCWRKDKLRLNIYIAACRV